MSLDQIRRVSKLVDLASPDDLDHYDRLILWTIADGCNQRSGKAYKGVATIARLCGVHRSTVQRRLERLHRAGAIRVKRRDGRTHEYEIPNASASRVVHNLAAREREVGTGDLALPGATPRALERDPLALLERDESGTESGTQSDGQPSFGRFHARILNNMAKARKAAS